MELKFLYWLQSIRFEALDKIIVFLFNTIIGDRGQFWVVLGIILLIFKKTRRVGIGILLSYILCYFLCDGILKDLIARPRPYMLDGTVDILVKTTNSFSFPSVHVALAFASAYTIFIHNKTFGKIALVYAFLLGFARMYFFVSYPLDILVGGFIGIIIAILTNKLMKNR